MLVTGLSPGQMEAKRQVDYIAKDRGYHDNEERFRRMSSEDEKYWRDLLDRLHQDRARQAVSLAGKLYGHSIHFVFEFLKSTDLNCFICKDGAEPYIVFHLYQTQIVVESNEDGFTDDDLEAICSHGDNPRPSSVIKNTRSGFQSVFQVAWKAEVLSGDYSVAFTHRPGDSGLGMITPTWVNSSTESTAGITRFTLHLRDDIDAQENYTWIQKQLRELEPSILLFLKKLKRIDIHLYNDDSREQEPTESISMIASMDETKHIATLRRSVQVEGHPQQEVETRYLVAKHTASELHESYGPKFIQTEEEVKHFTRSEVAVAFPVSHAFNPLVTAQNVFAFLPIDSPGFNFLIHADFDTWTNRQDLESDSERNLVLLDSISDAAITAIKLMYEHDTLRYQWMQYFEGLDSISSERFWKPLADQIRLKISTAKILEPHQRGLPRLVKDLGRLGTNLLDEHGEPLLADLPGTSGRYISTEYSETDMDTLEDLGLSYMTLDQWLELVKLDLSSADSQIKARSATQDWHARVARNLSALYDRCADANGARDSPLISELRTLDVIPLMNGSWVSADECHAHFPFTETENLVPTGLGLDLLSRSACQSKDRVELYTRLGVTYPDARDVQRRILSKYSLMKTEVSLEASIEHLRFLYQSRYSPSIFEYSNLKVFNSQQCLVSPNGHDVYLISDHQYSLWQLSDHGQNKWFSEHVSFLNERYFEAPTSQSHDPSWVAWLAQLGVRDHPRLDTHFLTILSPICMHIVKEMPSKFLGFLKHAWESGGKAVVCKTALVKALREVQVPCLGSDKTCKLGEGYLPLPSMRAVCSEFMESEFFPFLDVGESWARDEDSAAWSFLEQDFAVRSRDSIAFYAEILARKSLAMPKGDLDNGEVTKGNDKNINDDQKKDEEHSYGLLILGLYKRIYSKWAEAGKTNAADEELRSAFKSRDLIYIPQGQKWVSVDECILDAPLALQHLYRVIDRYEDGFPKEDLETISELFQKGLGMRICTWKDAMDDLIRMKGRPYSPSGWRAYFLYERINREIKKLAPIERMETINILREAFESQALILVEEEGKDSAWLPSSSCIWSPIVKIPGKNTLNGHDIALVIKSDVEVFFVEVLGIPRAPADTVYDRLLEVRSGLTTITQMKQWLESLSSLIETGTLRRPPGELLKKRIFPVKLPNGRLSFVSSETEFAIIDRLRTAHFFQGKVKFLDLSLAETHRIKPLLSWIGLSDRYLSKLVTRHVSAALHLEGLPLSDMSHHIREKAAALTRIAVHFKSPLMTDGYSRDSEQVFYELMLKATMYQTDRIPCTLSVTQDGTTVYGQPAHVRVHIQHSFRNLAIYVTPEEASRETCLAYSVPERLAIWMLTDPTTDKLSSASLEVVKRLVAAVFAVRSEKAMATILEFEGIIEVDLRPRSVTEDPDGQLEPETTGETAASMTSSQLFSRPPTFPDSDSSDNCSTPPATPGSLISTTASPQPRYLFGHPIEHTLLGRPAAPASSTSTAASITSHNLFATPTGSAPFGGSATSTSSSSTAALTTPRSLFGSPVDSTRFGGPATSAPPTMTRNKAK